MKLESMKELNRRIMDRFPQEILMLGHGNLDSPIILIGEAPGAKEIELNQPFVGMAGKHLDRFLEDVGIVKRDVYITNVVKYRPIKTNVKTKRLSNRTPSQEEINSFKAYLYEEISIINPNTIITLGNIPLKAIFEGNLKIGDVHGTLMEEEIRGKSYNVFPLYHPAAVIYRPDLKSVYGEDLRKLREILCKI